MGLQKEWKGDRGMSGHTIQGIVIIVVMAAATLLTRFLPFILFPAGKKTPKYISFLGTTLPYATIGLLVVYCLKGVNLVSWPQDRKSVV